MSEPLASPRPHPSVVFTELDTTQAALLHLETKRYFSLNETGVQIWRLLEDGRDPPAIAESLVAEYRLEIDEARGKVAAFLKELADEGLIETQ